MRPKDMRPIESPSPNHDARPADTPVDILLLHYTGMASAAAALDRLRDPAAKVSAHYLVEEDGTVHALVEESRRAWHAGQSCWAGARDINGRSLGIEIVNPGHEFGYRPFPEAQMARVAALSRDILSRHAIPPARVLGHADVAPGRRQDPGELFDWAFMARQGVGLWPGEGAGEGAAEGAAEGGADSAAPLAVGEIQTMLARFGYEVPATGLLDEATRAVLTAFQRHYRPARTLAEVGGEADAETGARLAWLLARLG